MSVCLLVTGKPIDMPFGSGLMRPKELSQYLDGAWLEEALLGNGNTWVYSDLPVVYILNLIHNAAAVTWPLATTFVASCLFCCFSGAVYRAVLVACNLEWTFPAVTNVEN